MEESVARKVHELPHARNKVRVFGTRDEAGRTLAGMLEDYHGSDAIVLAIPAGGVPVAAAIARQLELPLDVAVVSKITLPWNSEAGYGAVGFDGTVQVNEALVNQLGLSEEKVERGAGRAREKVQRRLRSLRGDRPMPDLSSRTAILVDDGLASGFTMRVAVQAVRNTGSGTITVAVPTAHYGSICSLVDMVEALYCANIREGRPFAVADAYRSWRDVSEEEAAAIIESAAGQTGRTG